MIYIYILKYTKNANLKMYLLTKLNLENIEYFLPLFIYYIKNDSTDDFSITDYIIKNCSSIKLLINYFYKCLLL